jgi:H+-transporting ATPase
MEIAVVLAAGLQDWIDFGVIVGLLAYYQQLNSDKQ